MPWDALYQSAVLVLLLDFQNFYCCLHNTRLDSDQKKTQSGKSCINNMMYQKMYLHMASII